MARNKYTYSIQCSIYIYKYIISTEHKVIISSPCILLLLYIKNILIKQKGVFSRRTLPHCGMGDRTSNKREATYSVAYLRCCEGDSMLAAVRTVSKRGTKDFWYTQHFCFYVEQNAKRWKTQMRDWGNDDDTCKKGVCCAQVFPARMTISLSILSSLLSLAACMCHMARFLHHNHWGTYFFFFLSLHVYFELVVFIPF